jgi:hypothetical protein
VLVMNLARLQDPGLWLAVTGARNAGRKALVRLEALFVAGTPPQEIAREFALDQFRLAALDRLASAPDGWREVADIIPETDRKTASQALLSLCRHGLVRMSLIKDALWLNDAGRYIIILCSAGYCDLWRAFPRAS